MRDFYIGIDYSMNCPGMTILNEDKIIMFYNTTIKKYGKRWEIDGSSIRGFLQKKNSNEQERYLNISEPLINVVRSLDKIGNVIVGIEGYAYSGSGNVNNISEATQTMKYRLYVELGIEIEVISPTKIKKFATGKGNSPKDVMYDNFYDETGIDLQEINNNVSNSPISDIVDSYFIAKYMQKYF